MKNRVELEARRGSRFEIWARRKPESAAEKTDEIFVLRVGDCVVYRIAALPPYFQFYSYTHHADGPLTLEWDDSAVEIPLFYSFDPSQVAEKGVTFLQVCDGVVMQLPKAAWPDWYESDPNRPQLRFSPFRAWMNDPNGLCFIDGRYHLFYQFHPVESEWGPMHWGHAVSDDLYRWTHLPVFLHPEQNLWSLGATGGAFSGSAFVGPDDNLNFYYTERLPAYDLFKDYKEVQKQVVPSVDLLRPDANRLVLVDGPPGSAHDFRDPKVWYDAERRVYRMVLGAAIDGDPTVLLYGSDDGADWKFLSVLYRAPEHFRQQGARCVECPDFFELDGRFVIVMGFVGYTEPGTGRHNLLYAQVGSFQDDRFTPLSEELQELDFGTDFYAMQSFRAKERQIAFAWLFNWEFRKPAGSPYSGEFSLPRVLGLDAQSRLTMMPEEGYQSLRARPLLQDSPSRFVCEPSRSTELSLAGDLDGIQVIGRGADGESFKLVHVDGRLELGVAEDTGEIKYRSAPLTLEGLTLFFDRGVVEVFANDGAICGTRRTYKITELTSLEFTPADGVQLESCQAWSYNSVWA
ncbi:MULTISPECIES: GH32 C-terminal domain-containing protein [Rhizobium]|uniref:beta-fructofuranosidase n=1 Tax=Rhizobium phaseoli TaxID=396 RepID=A0A192TI14_9HYPH|nr:MULTISPECIES: GH32 C-terminal domain-containing protein [Rhizobium]ANL42876.1 glycosyl hydrolase family 32 protein [Rhizobium phaseoli]ANL55556.1 glycosyl hydrolase family 32 protein [Rhizobium phaseoli]ANL61862.1 glycosyl hydrolase family 32 protein [Rhizobium phaseoli]ANL87277.1 glycosyl hydrolase family 32 protein [Rhizobium phaseoli]ANL93786.1 glycosyl hydrolase family 32 protein [Rhizobium phaseoli]